MAFKRGRRRMTPAMLPKAIANAPVIRADFSIFDTAFWQLRAGSPPGNPIAFEAMWMWCVARELDREAREDLIEIVPQIDVAFLRWIAAQSEKNRGK